MRLPCFFSARFTYCGGYVKAFSPEEVREAQEKGSYIPDEVFEIINEFLIKSGSRTYITISQDELVHAITARMGVTRATVFENKWLDFEPTYKAVGWDVKYDKPGYNEDYDPFWVFTTAG